MKKIISLLVALVLCLPLCACGDGNDTPASEAPTEATVPATTEAEKTAVETEASQPTESQAVENADYWTLDTMVDDFGDAVDQRIIKGVFEGYFSNTATMNSDLTVWVFFEPEDQTFIFRLLEYGDHKATYLDSDQITLKIKVMSDIPFTDECTLYGVAPNGDLLMARDKNGDSHWGGNAMLNYLYYGYDVKFVIEIGSSKYSFTLYPDGFNDEFKEYKNSN